MNTLNLSNEEYVLFLVKDYPTHISNVCDRLHHRMSREQVRELLLEMERKDLILLEKNKNRAITVRKKSE